MRSTATRSAVSMSGAPEVGRGPGRAGGGSTRLAAARTIENGDRDSLGCRLRPEPFRRLGQHVGRGDRLRPESCLAGIEPLDRPELADEVLETIGLLADRPRRPTDVIARGRSVDQCLREARDHGHRRSKVVAQVRQQLRFALPRPLQLGAHRVEAAGELAHLGRALERQLSATFRAADRPSRDQPPQRQP